MEPVLENAAVMAKSHNWNSQEQKEEYLDVVANFSRKIKEETEHEAC